MLVWPAHRKDIHRFSKQKTFICCDGLGTIGGMTKKEANGCRWAAG